MSRDYVCFFTQISKNCVILDADCGLVCDFGHSVRVLGPNTVVFWTQKSPPTGGPFKDN